MSRKALIIGGSGQIGRALARVLLDDGWRVIAAQRHAADDLQDGCEPLLLDREQPGALAGAIGAGVDALVDTVAFDETHARQLLEIEDDIGAFVVISSASVYCDAEGRTLDEARRNGFPRFSIPIGEDQPTVAPGPETYSTRKVALEQALLQGARRPVTILRPGAIHGPGSRHPREWFFVKRILDDRRVVPLAWNGESRFHTSATANIAELVRTVLQQPATQILNVGDPQVLTVREIGRAVAAVYKHDWSFFPLDGPPKRGRRRQSLGASPSSCSRPDLRKYTRLPPDHILRGHGGPDLPLSGDDGAGGHSISRLYVQDVRVCSRRRLFIEPEFLRRLRCPRRCLDDSHIRLQ